MCYLFFRNFKKSTRMSRLFIKFNVFLLICFATSQIFAQGTVQSVKSEDFDDGILEKARNEYWNNIRTSGEEKDLAKIERNAYNAMHSMENREAFKSLSQPAWQPIAGSQGGHNSGRVRDITADPTNPNAVYISTASGGVWKTDNITTNPVQWINLSDRLPTLMGGAIAFAPPSTLLLGTGEGEGDGYKFPPGQGLFKSTDGGNNWAQVSAIGGAYAQIVIDSINPQIAYAAYNNNGYPSQSGSILKSIDGGTTWRKLTLSLGGPISIGYNTHNPLVLVAGGFGSIWRSADSGATWTKSITGLSGSIGRVAIANAPGDQNLYYASIGSGSSTNGVFMSTDAGLTWKKMTAATPPPLLGSQAQWCNAIAVSSSNTKQVYVAGLDLYGSNDNGATWVQKSTQAVAPGDYPSNYVHADHHRLKFIGNTLYDCGDGGLAKSTSFPYNNWNTAINKGLATLQFVGVDADVNFSFVTGGCQDNSTNRALINASDFIQTRGGDGGRGWVSPNDPSIVYTTYVRTTFYQSLDGGLNFNGSNLMEPNATLYRIDELNQGNGEGSPFYPAYDVSRDGNIVAFGGNSHIWMSVSGGQDNFTSVPPSKSTQVGTSNVIHLWQGEDQTSFMWAGSGNNVWRSIDQGVTWVSKSVGELVEGITSNPNNHNEIFVVTQGNSNGGGTQTTQKHFFKSEDGGVTFTNPATNFPPIGCWSIAYSPKNGALYVGTDKGVVFSYDGGVTWFPLMNGMPLAEVMSLKIKGHGNDTLLAGTYGRGMFYIDLSNLAGINSGAAASLPVSLESAHPNPITSENATIGFSLKSAGLATLTIHDLLGRELRILEKSYFDAGRHQTSFTTNGLSSGTYFVMLTANGTSVSQKIIVN